MEEIIITILFSLLSFLGGLVVKNCVDVATLKFRVSRLEEFKDGN